MTLGDILFGLLIVTGYFVSATVSRFFRRGMSGIIIGGVACLAVSVVVLSYGLDQFIDMGARGAPAE